MRLDLTSSLEEPSQQLPTSQFLCTLLESLDNIRSVGEFGNDKVAPARPEGRAGRPQAERGGTGCADSEHGYTLDVVTSVFKQCGDSHDKCARGFMTLAQQFLAETILLWVYCDMAPFWA